MVAHGGRDTDAHDSVVIVIVNLAWDPICQALRALFAPTLNPTPAPWLVRKYDFRSAFFLSFDLTRVCRVCVWRARVRVGRERRKARRRVELLAGGGRV